MPMSYTRQADQLRHGSKARYGWVANPHRKPLLIFLPTGTFTLQDTPSFPRRDNGGRSPACEGFTTDLIDRNLGASCQAPAMISKHFIFCLRPFLVPLPTLMKGAMPVAKSPAGITLFMNMTRTPSGVNYIARTWWYEKFENCLRRLLKQQKCQTDL